MNFSRLRSDFQTGNCLYKMHPRIVYFLLFASLTVSFKSAASYLNGVRAPRTFNMGHFLERENKMGLSFPRMTYSLDFTLKYRRSTGAKDV